MLMPASVQRLYGQGIGPCVSLHPATCSVLSLADTMTTALAIVAAILARMANAKGALQRVTSLSRSNGGLSINLMWRFVVAAVTSVALYGSEIWWRGQQDRLKKLQLLLNSQARAITGLLRSTSLTFLQQESCLSRAKDLLTIVRPDMRCAHLLRMDIIPRINCCLSTSV